MVQEHKLYKGARGIRLKRLNRDITYCRFGPECRMGRACDRALTADDMKKANADRIALWIFTEHPPCFKPICEKETRSK